MRDRIEVMHGVNLDALGRRDPAHYGPLSFGELEAQIATWAGELELQVRFFQSNHEGAFVEHLHGLDNLADAIIVNPGAWTHYAWAIHDALQVAALPTIEVHLSDLSAREEWRRRSVVSDLCLETISGRGPDGYRAALERLKAELV